MTEAVKGWRKHRAVLQVLALRRAEKAQSGLLGAWDLPGHIMPPAAYPSWPVPALVAQDRHGQALGTTGRQASVFFSVT